MVSDVERLQVWLANALQLNHSVLIKRLSANDTGVTGAHQAGVYVPNRIAFLVAPELESDVVDPRRRLDLWLASHEQRSQPSLIHYNNRRRGGTRNESRLTGFGGSSSAFQDPGNTSAIMVLSFSELGMVAEAWITRGLAEEEIVEGAIGPVDPGTLLYLGQDETGRPAILENGNLPRCSPTLASMPPEWQQVFPSPLDIVREATRLIPAGRQTPDGLLLERYSCSYSMFRTLEEAHWLPRVEAGFESINEFLAVAQTILQRRKARAGRNLELHLEAIFREFGVQYTAQAETEDGVRPDFVFPSIERYRSAVPGDADLDVLASKTTLRDRWHAVVREAAKVSTKHLFTMDDGLAPSQVVEVEAAGIQLVVPEGRLTRYPPTARSSMLTLRAFVERRLAVQSDGSRPVALN